MISPKKFTKRSLLGRPPYQDQDENDGHVDDDEKGHGRDGPGAQRARVGTLALVAVVREATVLKSKWLTSRKGFTKNKFEKKMSVIALPGIQKVGIF